MGEVRVRRRALYGAALAMLAPQGGWARNTPPVQSSDELRYLDEKRRLTVQVRINGQGPFPFMVDTGANHSVVSAQLAQTLELPAAGRVEMHGIAGVQVVDTVRAQTLTVGARTTRDMALSVLPQETLGVAGILGLEWLGDSSLMLDYNGRRMKVGSALPLPDERTIVVRAWTQRSGLTLLEASMPGQLLMAFIDSGSTTTVGNLALLKEAKRRRAITGDVVEVDLRSVTGQTLTCTFAVLSSLTMGKMVLRNVPLVVGPVHTFDYWGLKDTPAILLGSDILQQFDTVAMDFKRREVRFRVGERWGAMPGSRL